MLLILPIRTESPMKRVPYVNFFLIATNMLLYVVLDEKLLGEAVGTFKNRYLVLDAAEPGILQFLTYQFLHGDVWHLFGNMLFLWVFGNSVNGKMGGLPYLLFYLAGGVFAAWGWAVVTGGASHLIGASGSIAAITTAYLALFPRSKVTVLVWLFIFIRFFEVSAMVIILLKIVVWDNIVAPNLGGAGNVANQAHLAGYLFGFVGAMLMLWVKAVPRDQFDIFSLWRRWNLRREFASTLRTPGAQAKARFGSAARTETVSPEQREDEDARQNRIEELRIRAVEAHTKGDMTAATATYEAIMVIDPRQCLSEMQQTAIARAYYDRKRFPEAASAFERFVETYPRSRERGPVLMLLGIIYARDLREPENADRNLTLALETLKDEKRREQCLHWLRDVRTSLGREIPDAEPKGHA